MLLGWEAVALVKSMASVEIYPTLFQKMFEHFAGADALTLNDHFIDIVSGAVVILLECNVLFELLCSAMTSASFQYHS